jgi:hypothetical protein
MTFVGVRIEGGWLEVGFKAATRREYDEHQRVVAAAADLFWPQGAEPLDLARDPAEGPVTGDFSEPMEDRIKKWDERKAWLERQGLV